MTIYTCTIEKSMVAPEVAKWSNVYHISGATILDAIDVSDAIAAIEQAQLKDYVTITRIAVANPLVRGSSASRDVNLVGAIAGVPDTMLPLFNTVMVRLIPGGGRPSLKYLRLPLEEADIAGGQVGSALLEGLAIDYAAPLIALSGVVDEDGQPFNAFSFRKHVQMRQQGWHRRSKPGFKRGWVVK